MDPDSSSGYSLFSFYHVDFIQISLKIIIPVAQEEEKCTNRKLQGREYTVIRQIIDKLYAIERVIYATL